MTEIHLGYKAYDVHELLCHGIADAGGLYTDAKLAVKLLDTTFLPDEALPEKTFHAACGAALAGFLSGHRRKVVFVACDRPMFWLYGRRGVASTDQLTQARVATFPEAAAPAKFLNRLLADADVAPGLIPCRDDVSRLALLTSGSVDAALLSSRYMPAEVLSKGCAQLMFVGEKLRLPSTGLAISQYLFESEPQLVAGMVEIYRQAMKWVFDDDQGLLRKVLVETFAMPGHGLDQAVQVIRDCYTPFGYSDDNLLQPAVDNMAAGMGLSARVAGELYEFKYIKSYH